MKESQREISVLAQQIQKAIGSNTRCKFEIRTGSETQGRQTAERLLATLRLGGFEAELIELGSAPRSDILIESSQDCAKVALSLQSAFRACGADVQLLVHSKVDPETIVLHIGDQADVDLRAK